MTQRFELRHKQHAIGEFIASLEFTKGLKQSEIGPVADVLKHLADRLDLPAPTPPVATVRIGFTSLVAPN